jgi:hypothetical protein
MMKKIRYILVTLAAITGLAALAVSCIHPLDPPPIAGAGRVILSVSPGEAGSARTILPTEPPVFSKYELEFSSDSGDTVKASDTSGIAKAGVSQELDAGTWTATVKAYQMFTPTGEKETEYLAAQGSAPVTVKAGQVTQVTVPLAPVPISETAPVGIFTLTVTFPVGTSGTVTFGSDNTYPLTSSPVTASVEVDPGYYDLIINLSGESGKAGTAEKVHIYSGLESKAEYEFTVEDFTIQGTDDPGGETKPPEEGTGSP